MVDKQTQLETSWLEEGDAIIGILTNVGSVDAGDVPLNREGSQEFLHLALRFAKNRSTSSCKGRNGSGGGSIEFLMHLLRIQAAKKARLARR
jgi:hypothetical protein